MPLLLTVHIMHAGKTTGGPSAVSKTHKSFQPVLPCGNKLLQQKWDQTYYNDHQKLIKSAKPMVDNKPPPARPHIVSKLKKQQVASKLASWGAASRGAGS